MIEVNREPGLVRLTIRRPEKKNALTRAMYDDLSTAVDEAAADRSVHAIVLSGCEGLFTAGNDLDDFRARAVDPDPQPSAGLAFIERLMHCDTPVIAAVEGIAIGIGTTLLFHCDIVVAGRSARFRTPFVDLGLSPEAASTVMGPLRMGYRRALDLLVFGDTLDGQAALDAGLASQVVSDGEAETVALERARKLVKQPRDALRASKRLMMDPWREPAKAALERERDVFAERLRSPECQAVLAGMGKR
ncbi:MULTISPECIES: enoyl-CoA hydratase/isomerase family protein [Marinobacter]|uniref:enoyl-CoA hydratase/isomerase family protein n=1 Tax=Marinobacter TaxID=2742 RepID=UPI000DAD7A27|nr:MULTISPECIES: enoyl-CoA hydratase-related protein [Marinobacter]